MRLIGLFTTLFTIGLSDNFEPKFSLKPPYTQEDNQRWETGAGAKVEESYVRITPDIPSRTGYLWGRAPSPMTDWEAVLEFRIHSQTQGGGEGMAFWYVEKRMLGPVFGSADFWNGIGIFLDTWNNDGQGPSPLLTAIYNDGTRAYTNHDDGSSMALASCAVPELRNTRSNSFIKMKYYNKQLTVDYATRLLPDGKADYQRCFTVAIDVGLDKYFGVTAHTGLPVVTNPPAPQVADNHDIISITTTNLTPQTANLDQRRQEYKQEVEEKHTQNKQYHQMDQNEFKHSALTLINQIAGTAQIIEEAQFTVLNVFASNRRTGDAKDADTILGEIRSMLSTLQRHQATLQTYVGRVGSNNGGSGGGGGLLLDPNAQSTYNTWNSRQNQMLSDMRSMRAAIDMLTRKAGGARQPAGGAGGSAGGPGPMGDQIRSVLLESFNSFKSTHAQSMADVSRTLRSFGGSGTVNYDDVDGGSAGLGWFTWTLLAILCGEVVGIAVLQMKNKQSTNYHKLV